MPILQKLIKGSFVIIYRQELGFQVIHVIGSFPISDLPSEVFVCSHLEYFTNINLFYSVKMCGRAA